MILLAFVPVIRAADEGYQRPLAPGDLLDIVVEEAPELSKNYPVAGDGTIRLGFLGRIRIAGMTTEEASSRIVDLMTDSYFKTATVQVAVSEFVEGSIMVLGAVNEPGSYAFRGDELLTLVEIIAMKGGATERAALNDVKILRWKPGGRMERETITVNVKKMFDDLDFSRDQYLSPRDIVYVPEMQVSLDGGAEFLALGEVQAPGFHEYFEGMDMIRAVAAAGGVSREAKLEAARILRSDGSGGYSIIPVDLAALFGSADMGMNIKMKGGDILFVPSAQIASAGRVYFLGAVQNPGVFGLPANKSATLARMILSQVQFSEFANQKKVKVLRTAPDGSRQEILVDVGSILDEGNFDADVPLQDEDVVIIPERFLLF